MPVSSELWFLRFRDGRVVRVATSVLRDQLAAGRLPPEVEVRRSPQESWRPLEGCDEFSDALPRGGSVASRIDSAGLHLIGVPSLLEELLAALDCFCTPQKLAVGLLTGVLLLAATLPAMLGLWHPGASFAVGLLVVLGQMALLSRLSFQELSRSRSTSLREAARGIVGLTLRTVCTLGVVIGVLAAMRYASPWAGAQLPESWPGYLVDLALLALGLPVAGLAIYLTPLVSLLVVEECGLWTAVPQWFRLTRGRLLTLFVSQWLTATIGLFLTLPLALILLLVPGLPLAALAVFAVAAVTGYMAVANVFIYLHLRYSGR